MGSFPETYDDHIPNLLEYQGQIQKMWPKDYSLKKGISKKTNNIHDWNKILAFPLTFFSPISMLQGNKKGILTK